MSIESHVSELINKHKELDTKIEAAVNSPSVDDLEIAELKRKKLLLKDEIAKLQS